jgi:hypothetical protein
MMQPGFTGPGHYKVCIFRDCDWQVRLPDGPSLNPLNPLSLAAAAEHGQLLELEALIAEHMTAEHRDTLCLLHRMVHE